MEEGIVYVLRLKRGKYYVGHTAREHGQRFNEHFKDKGAEWTKRYKPVIVLRQFSGTLEDEDETTLLMMEEHGWTNVRGGKWCKVKMSGPPKKLLQRVLQKHPGDACDRCGHCTHAKTTCFSDRHLDGHALVQESESCTTVSEQETFDLESSLFPDVSREGGDEEISVSAANEAIQSLSTVAASSSMHRRWSPVLHRSRVGRSEAR